MLFKQYIPSAAIVIIAASFSFGCETRETELRAGYNIRPAQKSDSHRKQNDAAFLRETSNDLLLEIKLAELAVKKGSSPEVKEFAISVLTEHTIAIEEIREMASRMDVVLHEDLSPGQNKHYSRIAVKSGLQFDRAFCSFMSENNMIVLKKFEKIAQEGNSEIVKDWAWGKLGILRRQIALANEIEGGGSNVSAQTESFIE